MEDDGRPLVGRLYDFERRRKIAIKLGHRRAPSLESAILTRLSDKRSFYGYALSIITTVLPSEKSLKPPGTYPVNRKCSRRLLWGAFRCTNGCAAGGTALRSLSPEIYPLSGLVDVLTDPLTGIRQSPPLHKILHPDVLHI